MRDFIRCLLVVAFAVGTATAARAAARSDVSRGLKSGTILIEDFANPIHKWSTMNDPVMGGQSKSALSIKDGVARFTGKCAIVPFLEAPGFITMVTGGFFSFHEEVFPDITSCTGLSFTLKSNVDYDGYRISFGKVHVKGGRHASGYKVGPLLNLPRGDDFGEIIIPFDEFSSKWDDATGDITVSCKEDSQYCPSDKWLSNMKTMSFWGEGVEGDVDLEVQKISAVGCSSTTEEAHAPMAAVATTSLVQGTTTDAASGIPIGHGGPLVLLGCLLTIIIGVLAAAQRRRYIRETTYEEIPH